MEPPPDRRPVLVVLLGSLITRPRPAERARPKVLALLAKELASSGRPMLVLHGGGGFAREGVRRFALDRPPESPQSLSGRRRGATVVSGELRRLHLLVLRSMLAAGVAVSSVPPGPLIEALGGEVRSLAVGPYRTALDHGLVPLVCEDVAVDRTWGETFVDAGQLAVALAGPLSPSRAVFVADRPGLPTGRAGPASSIAPEVNDETLTALDGPSGGIVAELRTAGRAMLALARSGTDAVLISGLSDGALSRAVGGEAVYGSWAHAQAR